MLLLKRIKAPHIGKYTPVGGKLDPHESPKSAAIRETFEETGIRVPDMKFCGTLVESAPNNYNWTCFVYLAEIEYQEPAECNEGTLEWIRFEDVLNIPTPQTDWYIYKYVLENKPFMLHADYDSALNILTMEEEIEALKLI